MKNILHNLTQARPIALISLLLIGLAPVTWAGTVTTFATGLNNPRGLKFGPDGDLYVAEGGTGGLNSTDTCDQVIPPVGPYTANVTGARISKINRGGLRTTVSDNLPSSQTSPSAGSGVSGVADVAFIGDTLYALLGGAGCSHGVSNIPNGIIRVNANGTYDMVADLSNYYMTHPVQNPSTTDFEPDGVPYSMLAYNGDLYAIEPNHGELDRITPNGQITRIIDTSAIFGTVYVPTVMTERNGSFIVGNLGSFIAGGANVLRVTPSGRYKILYSGFTDILGIAYDKKGQIYVLETSTGDMGPVPFTGDVIQIDKQGQQTIIASGLFFPTGMTIGADGALYVSNVGFGPPPNGLGEILRISLQ